jgi:predicted unusual protein kinase regulating ubiquinone biosynthesis (AarF/ABC1/UbiB family)
MFKNLKSIVFLLNVIFIFGSEIFIYSFFCDYSNFIERLTLRLSLVNILCVKIFQAFALNNNLIDEKTNNKLLLFTDNAPWNISDIDLYNLIKISQTYNLCLENGYEKPINSGMISIVFKAYEINNYNKPVIIKMKRKNIEQKLNDAIENLLFSVYLLSFIPIFNKYQFVEIVKKNIEIIRHQTNFLEEVDNMNRIKINCKNLKYIKIPSARREVTEQYPNSIMMEFIEGIKINQIQKEDYQEFAKQVMKFGFVTTIVHGVTHGDLHGGNILFIKDNQDNKYPYKIGVIDFGIIYEVETKYKNLFFDIITQIFDTSPRETAIKILNSGIIEPPNILQKIPKEDYENIISFSTEIIDETVNISKKANQVQIYKFLAKLKDYLSNSKLVELGIRPSDNFIKIQLVLAMSQGVTLTLCGDKFIALADKVINELFHTNMII